MNKHQPVPVAQGQLLICHEPDHNGLPDRYRLWTVTRVRHRKNGDAGVTLTAARDSVLIQATATFPNGTIAPPFKLVQLSDRDLENLYKQLP